MSDRRPQEWSEQVPFVSVIVPVYNEPDALKTCLESLERQTYPSDAYEVIVVDNNSDESIEGIVDRFPHAAAAFEGRPGSYAARNRGIELASGEVFAFTDADCIPASQWLVGGVRQLVSRSDTGVIGGRIEMTFQEEHPTPVELVDAHTSFNQKATCARGHAVTANLFTKVTVIEEVGPFDDTLKSGADVEWTRRVDKAGYSVTYAQGAQVQHPARSSIEALREKTLRVATGEFERRRLHDCSTAKWIATLAWMAKPPVRTAWRILRDQRLPSLRGRLRAVVFLLWRKEIRLRRFIDLRRRPPAERVGF